MYIKINNNKEYELLTDISHNPEICYYYEDGSSFICLFCTIKVSPNVKVLDFIKELKGCSSISFHLADEKLNRVFDWRYEKLIVKLLAVPYTIIEEEETLINCKFMILSDEDADD